MSLQLISQSVSLSVSRHPGRASITSSTVLRSDVRNKIVGCFCFDIEQDTAPLAAFFEPKLLTFGLGLMSFWAAYQPAESSKMYAFCQSSP
jgi:hypothetical protein